MNSISLFIITGLNMLTKILCGEVPPLGRTSTRVSNNFKKDKKREAVGLKDKLNHGKPKYSEVSSGITSDKRSFREKIDTGRVIILTRDNCKDSLCAEVREVMSYISPMFYLISINEEDGDKDAIKYLKNIGINLYDKDSETYAPSYYFYNRRIIPSPTKDKEFMSLLGLTKTNNFTKE